MSDLISRKAVIEVLKETGIIQDNDLGHLVAEEINRIPTAYDPDKVVEQLEAELERPITDCDLKLNGKQANDREVVACKTGIKYAIEIVKGGVNNG